MRNTFVVHTPCLLLLNKAIHEEAISVLRKKPFVLDGGLIYAAPRLYHNVSDFMPNQTFRSLEHIHFRRAEKKALIALMREKLWHAGARGARGVLQQPETNRLRFVSLESNSTPPTMIDLADDKAVSCSLLAHM